MKPAPGVCTDEKVLDVKAAGGEVGEELKNASAERPISFTADPAGSSWT